MIVRTSDVSDAHKRLSDIVRTHQARLIVLLQGGERDYALLLQVLNDYVSFQRACDVLAGYATIAKSDLIGDGRDAAKEQRARF